ncbi:formylglycine-generating enzyme family protein [bacterium]|nr:formylglycine-generating enzyme family protein [bacterium]
MQVNTPNSRPSHGDPPDAGMVWVPAGTFTMGSDRHYPEEAPAQPVYVDGFWMDATTVTNAAFARFVEETGYVTVAERPLNPAHYPGAKPELLVPGSMVFRKPAGQVNIADWRNWWAYVPGASWRHPFGPGSAIAGDTHPVLHVAYEDAEAYARWAGKALPTEAEWERAARGGIEGADYIWGDELRPEGKMLANFWVGEFPWQHDRPLGLEGTTPVGMFPPNGYGLFDMAGNVWEWTETWFSERHPDKPVKACCIPQNPRGGSKHHSMDRCQPHIRIPRKVLKGGSHLCAANYCFRYRPAARSPQMVDSASSHIGFRCIVRPGAPARR